MVPYFHVNAVVFICKCVSHKNSLVMLARCLRVLLPLPTTVTQKNASRVVEWLIWKGWSHLEKQLCLGVLIISYIGNLFHFTKVRTESGLTHLPHTFRLQRVDLEEIKCFSLQWCEYSPHSSILVSMTWKQHLQSQQQVSQIWATITQCCQYLHARICWR